MIHHHVHEMVENSKDDASRQGGAGSPSSYTYPDYYSNKNMMGAYSAPPMEMLMPFPPGHYPPAMPTWGMMSPTYHYRSALHLTEGGKPVRAWEQLSEDEQRKKWPYPGTRIDFVAAGQVIDDSYSPINPEEIPSAIIDISEYPDFSNITSPASTSRHMTNILQPPLMNSSIPMPKEEHNYYMTGPPTPKPCQ